MDKKTLLIRYLDGELTEQENDDVRRNLETDQEARRMLEQIRLNKQKVFEQLNRLNPDKDMVTPVWSGQNISTPYRALTSSKLLRWAAILIIPVAIFFMIREMTERREPVSGEPDTSETVLPDGKDQKEFLITKQTNIDYAISPNRIWTKKQMVSTELITNSL